MASEHPDLKLVRVAGKADRARFIELPYRLYANDPQFVPPLRSEMHALLTPTGNPWFGHARAGFWIVEREGLVVGRISAQVDDLVLSYVAPDLGHWGLFECEDDRRIAKLLVETA